MTPTDIVETEERSQGKSSMDKSKQSQARNLELPNQQPNNQQ